VDVSRLGLKPRCDHVKPIHLITDMNFKSKFDLRLRFRSFVYESVAAKIARKGGQSMVGIILRLLPAMQGKVNPNVGRVVKTFFRRLSTLAISQGIPGLVKYLKACSVLTQQSIAGYKIREISPRVSRTKSGLPRLLPAPLRRLIRVGCFPYIRVALTCLSVFRDMIYKSPVKLSTIEKPFSGKEQWIKIVNGHAGRFVSLFAGNAAGRSLCEGKFKPFPIIKASPQSGKLFATETWVTSTHPITLLKSALALTDDQLMKIKILYGIISKGTDYSGRPDGWEELSDMHLELLQAGTLPGLIQIVRDSASALSSYSYRVIGRRLITAPGSGFTGKLGLKQEAAGKMRVFAMVDPWTQMIMSPFHDGIFKILRRHSMMDGTFDQLRPLNRAWGFKHLYSMDLSAATDRLPMAIQVPLFQTLFKLTDEEVDAWRSLLVDRSYVLKQPFQPNICVKYAVGQPMGALSSWPMLALTHHLIVQTAAWQIGYRSDALFRDYAVLGDDIVIYNKDVAKMYHKIIIGLGVECNLAKSILSVKGLGLEFAKKTFFKGQNVSPTPLKEFYSALMGPVSLVSYGIKYNLSFPALLHVAGFGYRVRAKANLPFWRQTNYKVKTLMIQTAFLNYESNPEIFHKIFGKRPSRMLSVNVFWTWMQGLTYDLLSRMKKSKALLADQVIPSYFLMKKDVMLEALCYQLWFFVNGPSKDNFIEDLTGIETELWEGLKKHHMRLSLIDVKQSMIAFGDSMIHGMITNTLPELLALEQRVAALTLDAFTGIRRDSAPIGVPVKEFKMGTYKAIYKPSDPSFDGVRNVPSVLKLMERFSSVIHRLTDKLTKNVGVVSGPVSEVKTSGFSAAFARSAIRRLFLISATTAQNLPMRTTSLRRMSIPWRVASRSFG